MANGGHLSMAYCPWTEEHSTVNHVEESHSWDSHVVQPCTTFGWMRRLGWLQRYVFLDMGDDVMWWVSTQQCNWEVSCVTNSSLIRPMSAPEPWGHLLGHSEQHVGRSEIGMDIWERRQEGQMWGKTQPCESPAEGLRLAEHSQVSPSAFLGNCRWYTWQIIWDKSLIDQCLNCDVRIYV